MAERKSQKFPHIQLQLTRKGSAAPPPSGSRKSNPITSANRGDRQGHGKKLQSEVFSMVSEWEDIDKKREEEEKPKLPDNSRRLILQIDPATVDPDKLKGYGIELIAELENGYIIGASVDLELSELQKKIEIFIEEENKNVGVAGIWEIIDGIKKPELILSPELWSHWEQVQWECSKKGEDPDQFLARILKNYDAPEDSEKGEGLFKWTLGKQSNYGKVKDVSRSAGTIQKDWVIVNSYNLREAFCIAVVGHEGWNNDPDTNVPYSLVVSFEAIGANIPIYNLVKAEIEVETEIREQVRI